MNEGESGQIKKRGRTDFVYDSIELGLVARGKEDIETRFGELDRKLASDAVRRASDDFCVVKSRGEKKQAKINSVP